MKLRNQLLTLSLATLLVPWFGWRLVQELEQFLRAGQESALLASARTLAQALPAAYRAQLAFGRDQALPLREFERAPILDGYQDDWPDPGSALVFESPDSGTSLELLAGRHRDRLYLLARVADDTPHRSAEPAGVAGAGTPVDELRLFTRSVRGLNSFLIQAAAPGPLLIHSQAAGGGQLEGFWLEVPGGYHLELALPPSSRPQDVAFGVIDARPGAPGQVLVHAAGLLADGQPAAWLRPAGQDEELQAWLDAAIPAGSRAWVVDRQGWVMASAGVVAEGQPGELSWAERLLYRVVAGRRTVFQAAREEPVLRFGESRVTAALDGQAGQLWSQDRDSAVVRNTVAVPIGIDGQPRGAVVMEASQDGLLLVTNRALGRLLLSTLLVTVGLAAGLWWFASRLSRRVRRLSEAVSAAMDDTARPGELPLATDRDELGDLARDNARLLRAVADYTGYLNKLAGRLSHELKTPLAITRSSLDNLDASALDEDSRRYLSRAREGLDRQAAIVRAMSAASRLESAVRAAEWERTDLAELLRRCLDGYRSLHPGREIELEAPERPVPWTCAPDLLVQALDKLVDNALGLTGPEERITICLRPAETRCEVAVRNTGTRLPDTLKDQLFDSLVSVRSASEEAVHMGLGLYIVRLVAEAHGGSVRARNLGDDSGVEFVLDLAAP